MAANGLKMSRYVLNLYSKFYTFAHNAIIPRIRRYNTTEHDKHADVKVHDIIDWVMLISEANLDPHFYGDAGNYGYSKLKVRRYFLVKRPGAE